MILPQSKNSQTSSLWDAFAYTLAILYYENFKMLIVRSRDILKDVLIKDILFYLNNNYREKNHFRAVIEKISCQRQLYLP